MEELKAKIRILEEKISKLEGQLQNYDVTEGLKDRFFGNTGSSSISSATTKNLSLTGEVQTIAVVDETKLPLVTGTLQLIYKGKIINLLYQ